MNDPNPNLEPCPYLELPDGGFRVRLLDPIGDQIGEVDCDTEEDAIAISRVRPLLFQTEPIDRDQFDSTLAALERGRDRVERRVRPQAPAPLRRDGRVIARRVQPALERRPCGSA